MPSEPRSAAVGNGQRLVGDYLRAVRDALASEEGFGLVGVETHVTYTFDANGAVKREGGSELVSAAHGVLAQLEIAAKTDDGIAYEVVTHVEPRRAVTWHIAKILIEAAR